jgi:hypothetical protein
MAAWGQIRPHETGKVHHSTAGDLSPNPKLTPHQKREAVHAEPGQRGPIFLTPCHCKHSLPDRIRVRASSDRNGIT